MVRLHFANPWTAVIVPWLIFGSIFALNWAIWFIVWVSMAPADRADMGEGLQWNGAVFYFFVYMLVVAVQAMNATFSYALGMGATRREFYLGSLLTFLGLSILGGLWVPLSIMPGWMGDVAQAVPSYWLNRLGQMGAGATGDLVPPMLVLAAWSLVLGALIVWRYRRDAARA